MKQNIEQFCVGDIITPLDEILRFKVIDVEGNGVLCIDENGFEVRYKFSEIIKSKTFKVSYIDRSSVETSKRESFTIVNNSQHKKNIPEIDLHWYGGKSDYILDKQLNRFVEFINKCEKNKHREAIIIHGVGEGILKTEVRNILRQKHIKYHDAEYSKYGIGGTHIYLKSRER